MATVLHTSDWHVGKTIRGRSRADEHRAVLGEISEVAAKHHVDAVVIAGDLFDTVAPTAEAEEIVYRALLSFAATGAEVLIISGNHDNASRLRAVAPLLELGNVHLVCAPSRPDDGGVRTVSCRSGGELDVAMLPFVSQRGIVRAEHLMGEDAYVNAQEYSSRLGLLIGTLAGAFVADRPSVLVSHAFVQGGLQGGGERAAHLIEEYLVNATSFPATIGYVALGHLHRAQKLPGATAIHYCGSPLQLDFGEKVEAKQVNVVEVEPGVPAKVTVEELTAGCPLVTLSGTVAELEAQRGGVRDDAWIRVRVREPRRSGIANEVRDVLGERVVDVIVEPPGGLAVDSAASVARRGATPRELFDEFLTEQGIDDPRLGKLFDELHDEVVQGGVVADDEVAV